MSVRTRGLPRNLLDLLDPLDRRRQYENVPKNADRLFGSLHFVPSAAPVNRCCAATPTVASFTCASGWNHCIAPQVGSCVRCLFTSSATWPALTSISLP